MFISSLSRRRTKLFVSLLFVVLTGPLAIAQSIQDGQPLVDRMLETLGGREAWASLRNTVNGSQQNRTVEPTVVYAVISMDFEQPRFRIETTARDIHLIRVVDGEDSWRLNRAGKIEALTADRVASEMQWYGAHLYRTIHRVAARDSSLTTRLGEGGRLEIFEEGERLMWLRLDARGEPYAFGFYADEVGSLSGPWDVVKDGIHHPRWVSSVDGTWRAAVKALEFNVPLHESLFVRPAVQEPSH